MSCESLSLGCVMCICQQICLLVWWWPVVELLKKHCAITAAWPAVLHCKELTPKIRNKYSQKRNWAATVPISTSCVCECFYILYYRWSAYSAAGNMWTDPGNIEIAHRHMNVKIGTEAAQFPEKEYINGIFVAVCHGSYCSNIEQIWVCPALFFLSLLRLSLVMANKWDEAFPVNRIS
jgi:hypothetical protein